MDTVGDESRGAKGARERLWRPRARPDRGFMGWWGGEPRVVGGFGRPG